MRFFNAHTVVFLNVFITVCILVKLREKTSEFESLKTKWNNLMNSENRIERINKNQDQLIIDSNLTRDFYRYDCKILERFGKHDIDPFKRIDGSWFVCSDDNLRLNPSNCIVLSFGINTNEIFDRHINSRFNCVVHSFDPFVEPTSVKALRNLNNQINKNATSLKLNSKWTFHSIGITNYAGRRHINQIGWMETYANILIYLNLNNKTIDYFKIDVENAEWDVLKEILTIENGFLFCKYVKQFAIETHPHNWKTSRQSHLAILRKLETCFRLYRRDQRFFLPVKNAGKTEWQMRNYMLPLSRFQDETDLANFMFLYGELYFVNINFLKTTQ